MRKNEKVGILVGGGPAPGINSVINAVTIEAVNSGYSVIGIYEGFKYLEKGEKKIEFLNIPKVSRLHLVGGSVLKTSRTNPTKSEEKLKNVVETLKDMEIKYLVTIGGDDTAFGAMKVSEAAEYMGYDLRVAHVPKTIDNDLPLPAGIPTFGYETARAEGARLASILAEDARTSGRWYIVICMGRKTGHLALGVGKSAGATLTLIPEEFVNAGKKITLKLIVDHIVGSILKRLCNGLSYGLAILAEGFLEFLDPKELETYLTSHESLEKDEYGHIRLSELNFSDIIKHAVKMRLKEFDINMGLVDQEFGYELRCLGPCASDIDYTRNLGYAAIDFLRKGDKNAMITIQGDQVVPMYFKEIFDPETQKTKVRYVDTNSLSFKIAQEYMIRLEKSDFADEEQLKKLAHTVHLSPKKFREEFEYLVK